MADILTGRRIVVGVDGSAASDAAVRWAAREARLRGAILQLVHAHHDEPGAHAPYAPCQCVTTGDWEHTAARAVLTNAAGIARCDLLPAQVTAELAEDLPVRALLERAADADMLVLGTSRPAPQHGLPPREMGPVGRDCLRLASCPVVVISVSREPLSHQRRTVSTDV